MRLHDRDGAPQSGKRCLGFDLCERVRVDSLRDSPNDGN